MNSGGRATTTFRIDYAGTHETDRHYCREEDCGRELCDGLKFGKLSYKYFEEGPFKGRGGAWRPAGARGTTRRRPPDGTN